MRSGDLTSIILFCSLLIITACGADEDLCTPLGPANEVPVDEIIHIPVVVHVVNNNQYPFDLSDEKIYSQIEVLNNDFRKKNVDYIKTPEEFLHLVADVGIEFHLAVVSPNGESTNGIIRSSSGVSGWDGVRDEYNNQPIEELSLYFTSKGGQDAWPSSQYLNIWIADLSDRWGKLGMAGYAAFPGADSRIDGVVIDPRVFGTTPPLEPKYDQGRTATHEIGHWLNLLHVYAKDMDCESSDLVDDTPSQFGQYLGTPNYPQFSCGHSNMFMNYMDRVDDKAMFMFTEGQKLRIRALFNKDGARRKIYENSILKPAYNLKY